MSYEQEFGSQKTENLLGEEGVDREIQQEHSVSLFFKGLELPGFATQWFCLSKLLIPMGLGLFVWRMG